MSNIYIPLKMEDGSELYISSVRIGGGGEVLANAPGPDILNAMDCIKKAMPQVGAFCQKAKTWLQEKVNADEIELEFSVSFTGDMKAIIASAGAEAGISVHLTWKNDEKK